MSGALPLTSHAATVPLGELLVTQALLSQEQLEAALQEQREKGGRLGSILTGNGMVSALDLYQTVARHYGVEFANLLASPPDSELLERERWEEYLLLELIPWKRQEGKVLLAVTDVTPVEQKWADNAYGEGAYRFVVTTPRDIREAVAHVFPDELDRASRLKLWQDAPEKSARITFLPEQRRGALLLLVMLCVPMLLVPGQAMLAGLVVINLFYLTTILFKFMLFYAGQGAATRMQGRGADLRRRCEAMDDAALPPYTLLVPLYQEAESLPRLLADLRAIDYPHSRLDIKLIIEEDDTETLRAAKALHPEAMFEIIPVPYSLPRTKPKACNYALRFARGEYVTIYDAEDRPDPMQLKKAVLAFREGPQSLLCLQARLNYYNRDYNLLTRLFSVEYAAWFDYMLPALEKLAIPIPLGGTSNHIALSRLRQLGEWDPYNVTEDADLGIRLALASGRTRVLDSLTLEEAPISLWAWIRQRTRWIKGYMQTWLVHMRRPLVLYHVLGARAFWGFQFFVGGPCLAFLLSPIFWAVTVYWLVTGEWVAAVVLPEWVILLSVYNFAAGLLAHGFFALQVMRHKRWSGMAGVLLAFPFYWVLHSLASFRALWQLCVAPHRWEKTSHGHTPPMASRAAV